MSFGWQLETDIILNSLTNLYHQFILNYNMNNLVKTIMELHCILKTIHDIMIKSRNFKSTTMVLAMKEGIINKNKTNITNEKGRM